MLSGKLRVIRYTSIFVFAIALCGVFVFPFLRSESAPPGIGDVQKPLRKAQSIKKRTQIADLLNDCSPTNQLVKQISAAAPYSASAALCFNGANNLQPATLFGPVAVATQSGPLPSPGNPYPANITVSGLTGGLVSISVVFNSMTFSGGGAFMDDMDFILVSPGPTSTAKAFNFWSEAGGNQVTNLTNVTIADTGATFLPNNAGVASSTTYKPTDQFICNDAFVADAGLPTTVYNPAGNEVGPACGSATFNGTFGVFKGLSGTNLNGTWKIYLIDHSADGGESMSVSLNITAAGPTAASANIGGRVVTSSGQGIGKAIITLSGGGLTEPIQARTSPFGYYNFPDLPVGGTYVVTISSKRYTFANPSRTINLQDNVTDADFVSEE